jgi:CBS domain-containing protein
MLQGHAVSEAMTRDCLTVPPDLTLDRLVNEHILPSGYHCFVVASESHIQGLITLKNIRAVPQKMWATKKVTEIMAPFKKLKQVRPDEDLASVMSILTQEEINQLPVVEGDNIVGIISRENLLAFINIRDKLGM